MKPQRPILAKSYKGRFPFRLGTTSFIYPDGYAANVALLAPYVDEIELLMFESRSVDSMPGREEIRQLQRLAATHRITYSVHLPIDVHPGGADPAERRQAVDALVRIIERTAALEPCSYIVHLPYVGSRLEADAPEAWQEFNRLSLQRLIARGVPQNRLCIENLDYPMDWIRPILGEFGLPLCLDIGHLIIQGVDPAGVFERFRDRISVVHLHGVQNGRDHLALTDAHRVMMQTLVTLLRTFRGSLSLEVFDFSNLEDSLAFFEKLWQTGHT
jgi:sugar phosphate isomerase/epimerase